MRRRVAIGLVAGCLAFAGVAAGMAAGEGSTIANERTAKAQVGPLLASVVLPLGAARVGSDPAANSALNAPAFSTVTPARVDAHAFWRVPGAPQAAIAWIRAHPPVGSSGVFVSGVQTRGGVPDAVSLAFSFPVKRGLLRSETLGVVATGARGGDSALLADAQVVWWVARPTSERIPSGVRLVSLTVARPGRPPGLPRMVSSPARVRQIVALVDALTAEQPGSVVCPADFGPLVTLAFRSAPNVAPVAVATADGSGCGFVTLGIRGRARPGLSGGPKLIGALDKLLGVHL